MPVSSSSEFHDQNSMTATQLLFTLYHALDSCYMIWRQHKLPFICRGVAIQCLQTDIGYKLIIQNLNSVTQPEGSAGVYQPQISVYSEYNLDLGGRMLFLETNMAYMQFKCMALSL